MADVRICREIRKVQGGYAIYGLRWPYGNDPSDNGTAIFGTWIQVLDILTRASMNEEAKEAAGSVPLSVEPDDL